MKYWNWPARPQIICFPHKSDRSKDTAAYTTYDSTVMFMIATEDRNISYNNWKALWGSSAHQTLHCKPLHARNSFTFEANNNNNYDELTWLHLYNCNRVLGRYAPLYPVLLLCAYSFYLYIGRATSARKIAGFAPGLMEFSLRTSVLIKFKNCCHTENTSF